MSRILCVWEMGTALGHLTNLKLFVDEALRQGHQVSLAVRELQNVATIFDLDKIRLFQSPMIRRPRRKYNSPMICFSQLILRQVFTNGQELEALYCSWNSLFDAVQPDLVIYDHAPSALVASVGKPWNKWVIGSGFLVPRYDGPFLGVFPGTLKSDKNDVALAQAERELLSLVNGVLMDHCGLTMESVKDIYRQCDQQLLLTVPELDHFGCRRQGTYLGLKWSLSKNSPQWLSKADGVQNKIRAFAYLNYFPGMPKLLDALLDRQVDLLMYSRTMPKDFIRDYSGKVAFVFEPVDLNRVCKEAAFIINQGNHGSAAQAYVMGCPQLLLPTHQEQMFLSQRIEQQGRAVLASGDQPDFSEAIDQVLKLPKGNARDDFSLEADERALFERIQNLLSGIG